MFERYTEKARRVIFYARYEASQFGSPEIETEHLLLGLLKEDSAQLAAFLQRPIGTGALRARIRQRYGEREPFSTSIDIPLTEECKRVLAYAAEEADRFGHRHIGAEHLFLGLLREERSFAGQILREHGASLKEVRRHIEKAPAPEESAASQGMGRGWGMGSSGAPPTPNVRIVGEDGSLLQEVFWNARPVRIPLRGEAIELEYDGRRTTFRVLDVIWTVVKAGDALVNSSHVVLKVRAEGQTNSSPPPPEI